MEPTVLGDAPECALDDQPVTIDDGGHVERHHERALHDDAEARRRAEEAQADQSFLTYQQQQELKRTLALLRKENAARRAPASTRRWSRPARSRARPSSSERARAFGGRSAATT